MWSDKVYFVCTVSVTGKIREVPVMGLKCGQSAARQKGSVFQQTGTIPEAVWLTASS